MSKDIERDAQKTVDDLKEGRQTHDLSKVFEDIRQHAKDPKELQSYLAKVNEDMQKDKVIPGLELVGLDDKNIVFKEKATQKVIEVNDQAKVVKEVPATPEPDTSNHGGTDRGLSRDADRLTKKGLSRQDGGDGIKDGKLTKQDDADALKDKKP